MGLPLPEKLKGTCATLGALSIFTFILRCYVRIRLVKSWGLDDTFISMAFVIHMWYTGTLLTGIHYGTGQRTTDISVQDSVHAMRCWWLCFLAYACSITLAKISAGFFFLRIAGVMRFHRIATYVITLLAAVVGFVFLFVSMFQCSPVDFFWTRLQGETNGRCIDIEVIIKLTYLYGTVTALTDVAYGVLVAVLTWNLQVDRRTKMLIAPLLAMACIASYAALVRMPYIKNFRKADFLYATVDISLWSTVEVGVSVFAANLATLRPLVHHITQGGRSWSLRSNKRANIPLDIQELHCVNINFDDKRSSYGSRHGSVGKDEENEAESTRSLTRSTKEKV
ncbi:hypothetical protein HBH98_127270 [Parastagonospora nodorum]|nr:hypothetical protein HBH53_034530 [Parastagonospora nodorum]KAH3984527.1 hypothetical protein HBH51_024660 [Parastagonospora nodorum]KAH4036964.1 hypothetical protein HBI09_079650 [Parastagonospora nodorum]KAH4051628.1 hypothetical protein HBH49_105960 [Parastagonospora nodorum]KAH4344712.1 hypothetical protein HBH98_127270 [Parastagonospora nodorum]